MRRTDTRFWTPSVAAVLAAVIWLALGPGAPAAEAFDFTVSPQTPVAGQNATFTATGLRPNESVTWDFENDGVFDATGPSVQHAYPTAGTWTVRMRSARPGSEPREVTKVVSVTAPPAPPPPPPSTPPPTPPPATAPPSAPALNRPPLASFVVFPRQPLAGEAVAFVSTSSDLDGPIASYAWDLDGDGQFDDSSEVAAVRSFSAPGLYSVSLRVTDARGAADVESRAIVVGGALFSSRPALMSPFPVVRIVGSATTRGARIRLLLVRSVPRGARVTVRCSGSTCARRRQTRIVRSGRVRLRSFERLVGAGVRIRVYVTQRGRIGKYTSFRIRSMKPPVRRDLCVTSDRARPRRCPSA